MPKTGPHNALTDVAGLLVGHYTDWQACSGVSVVLCPEGAVAGVVVAGAAPGTRETDLLDPVNTVEKAQAVILSGGSVFGLAAADGVVRWLAERGLGFPLGTDHVAPIVPGATLFDLGQGPNFRPPVGPDWGFRAAGAAKAGPVAGGSVGAGAGAWSGGIKGGIGTASEVLANGLAVAALVAVNSMGSVIDPKTGRPWEIGLEIDGEFGPLGRTPKKLPEAPPPRSGQNTTLAVVATDALLTKAQAKKMAQMAHDGLARAIRPAHTMFDGDTVFALATGRKPLPQTAGFFAAPQSLSLTEVGRAAADCLSRAIIRAVLEARSGAGATAFQDLPDL